MTLMAVVGASETDSSRFERGIGRLRAGGAGVERLPAQCQTHILVTFSSQVSPRDVTTVVAADIL